jgi:site-specific DNA recombinase
MFLRLAETLTAFLARLRSAADTLDVIERQRIVRLVVKEVLIGDDTIIIRHCIPIASTPPASGGQPAPSRPDGAPTGQSYLLHKGSGQPNFIKRFSALCVRFVDDADIPAPSVVSVCG